jgi:hypothetical protein
MGGLQRSLLKLKLKRKLLCINQDLLRRPIGDTCKLDPQNREQCLLEAGLFDFTMKIFE